MNRTVMILEYNAFTDQPFAGNPAGVVLDGSGLEPELMQRIARQMNLAETAFLVSPTSPDVDIRLRWFTPAIEVDLCGHATIATFAAAAEHGVFPVNEGAERVLRVETLSGVLRIRITREQGRPRVAMQIPVPAFQTLDLDRDGFASLWGVEVNALSGDWLRHEELNYWYFPVAGQNALRALTLDAERLSKIDDTAAFAFYTTESVDTDSHWHLRFFAPFHGVAEDIVTGSAQGPMGVVYQDQIEGVAADGWSEYKGEQGDSLGRPGRVLVRVQRKNGAVGDVEIAGGAMPMLEGQIRV